MGLLVFLGFFAAALLLQWHSGAYRSEFGAHADEPAHVVTGLMVRDYLADGLWSGASPMAFARAYYERYPKVALGHYPPAFYLVEGVWLLPIRSPAAVLVLMAALSAGAGWLTWRLARHHGLSPGWAWLPAALFVVHPLVRTYTNIVMSDLLLVIFCLLATDAWRRFLRTSTNRHSLAFGLWAAAAILTKGSGLFLALVPPLSILLTAKWRLLKCRALWLAPLPVLMFALPWMLATRHITAEGMSSTPLSGYVPEAVAFFAKHLPEEFGWLACGLLLFVILEAFLGAARRRPVGDSSACLVAMAVGLLLLYLVVPAGLDARYLLPLAPALFILGIDAIHRWTRCLPIAENLRPIAGVIAIAIAVIIILAESQRPVHKQLAGYADAIDSIVQAHRLAVVPPADGEFVDILVASNASGEGALVAAAAFRPEANLKIHRSTKVLIETDWLGRDPKMLVTPGPEANENFRQLSIDWLLIDDMSAEGLPQIQIARDIASAADQHIDPSGDADFTISLKHGDSRTFLKYRWIP